MIDGAREFALRWLLEPTKKSEDVQYEFNLSIVTYHGTEQKFTDEYYWVNDNSSTYGKNIDREDKIKWLAFSDFATVQAKIYKISETSEYLGTAMYLFPRQFEKTYKYYNKDTGEDIDKKTYIYYLTGTVFSSNNSFRQYTAPYQYESSSIITKHNTGDLIRKYQDITNLRNDIFTAEFYTFPSNTTFTYTTTSSGIPKITVRHFTHPKYEITEHKITETPEGITEEDLKGEVAEVTDGVLYTYLYKGFGNFDEYEDKIGIESDVTSNIPILIKCFDGLDYQTFVDIYNATSNFKNNTTITFEHD